MDVFNKLFGKKNDQIDDSKTTPEEKEGQEDKVKGASDEQTGKTAEQEKITFPYDITIIEGKLSVKMFNLTIALDDKRLFTALAYVTKGLKAVGQEELVMLVKHEPLKEGEFFEEALHFFHQMYNWAEQGKVVRKRDWTVFREKGLLGHFGILYVPTPVSHEFIPPNSLSMVMLSRKEADAVGFFGSARLLMMLGKINGYYPYPYWSDFQRPELPIDLLKERSMLGRMPGLNLTKASATLEQGGIVLTLPKEDSIALTAEQVPNSPVSIIPGFAEQAGFSLVWPEGDKPAARCMIGCPIGMGKTFSLDNFEDEQNLLSGLEKLGTVLNGCCIIISPEQAENKAQTIEDGFAVLMKNDTWNAFWQALIAKNAFDMDANEGLGFRLRWV